ncbi:MAG: TonB-dependent receptor [Pseudomonadales bacterium]|nr:TonB-dependent receptor [Pseudomonadales bacterium]
MANHFLPFKKREIATIPLLAALVSSAHAQIEEVVVTAQKRDQSIQDVPIAISVFGSEDLKNLGAGNLQELTEHIPGAELYDERGAGQPTWVIRGVSLTDYNSNNTPTAPVYYDEVYLVSNVMSGIGLFDTARVEVLKGPQTGLYGRNTTGGAVRVLSTEPSLKEHSGYVSGSYGRWDRYSLEGAYGGPISDTAAFRISAKTDLGGGWQDTLATPGDDEYGDKNFWAAKGQLLFQPTSDLEVLLKLEGGENNPETTLASAIGVHSPNSPNVFARDYCGAVVAGGRDNANCLTASQVLDNVTGGSGALSPALQSSDGSTVLSEPINELDNEWTAFTARITWDLGFATLTSVTGYMDFDNKFIFDYDATEREFLRENGSAEIKSWSQELRLASNTDGALQWIAAMMYSEEENKEFRLAGLDNHIFFQAAFACDPNPPFACPPGFPSSTFTTSRGFEQEGESWAIYGHIDLELSEQLKLNASLRYTDEEKRMRDGFFYADLGSLGGFYLHKGTDFDFELDSHWSGHIGLDWTPTDNALIYGKVTRGFKSGGFFGGFPISADNLAPYDEEIVWAYEVGFKTDWFENRLRINGAFFYYDYQDLQDFNNQLQLGVPIGQLDNIGDAEVKGLELDVTWLPEAIEGLSLNLALSLVDIEITDSNNLVITQDGQFIPVEGLKRRPGAEESVSVRARYEWPTFDSMMAAVQVSYSYRSDIFPRDSFANALDAGIFDYPGYDLVNARLSLSQEEGRWSISLAGYNLAGEEYLTSASGDALGSYVSISGTPRRWALEATYNF